MSPNPFSPSFAILPSSFFGRSAYIERFGNALDTPNSAFRTFFLTGTRGIGKTSLLHQYELQAKSRGWDVVKGTNIDALDRLVRYVGLDGKTTRGAALRPSVTVGGVGSASMGEVSTASTSSDPLTLLGMKLVQKVGGFRLKKGLSIIIDEAQKLGKDDAVLITNAVQEVKSQGLPISLILCGLPNAYGRVRSLGDVTFIRRMKREMLWTMTKTETMAFLEQSFSAVPEMRLSGEQVYGIGAFSGGHPYLMQLVGDNVYRLMEVEYSPVAGTSVDVPDELIQRAEESALGEYKANVLDDVLRGVHTGTRDYLATAFELRDEHGRVATGDINKRFGRTAQEMSSIRAAALNTQVISVAGHGLVRFALPQYQYIFEGYEYDEPVASDDEWEL